MNIFATSPDPYESAIALDNVRLNKMIVESAQLLSTALRIRGVDDDRLYALSHMHHPCCHWVRATRGNFRWLADHAVHMAVERIHRGANVPHLTSTVLDVCIDNIHRIREGDLTPFHNSSMFKDEPDVCKAYRQTMRTKWDQDVIKLSWGNRGEPAWRNAYG